MADEPRIIDTSAVDEYEIKLKVHGNSIDVTSPPGQPLDVTWAVLARAARAYEAKMTATEVLNTMAQIQAIRAGGLIRS